MAEKPPDEGRSCNQVIAGVQWARVTAIALAPRRSSPSSCGCRVTLPGQLW